MNGYSGTLSPVSITSNEWMGGQRYQPPERPYSPSLTANNRSNLITPPVSGSSIGMNGNLSNGMNGIRPIPSRGNPSPPSSIARSSNGTTLSMDAQRRKQSMMEDSLVQHYNVLKEFLKESLRQDQAEGKPNRARDKLLRLSAVQFQELSTDVYDELLRRKRVDSQLDVPKPPGKRVEDFLEPMPSFHPKRNQARQKLSTLPDPRFRALATDVFFELERRFPRFTGSFIERRDSPANGTRGPPSRTGTPNGVRSESQNQQGGRRPYPPRQGSLGGQVFAGLGIPGMGSQDEYSRPTPKSSQSNTIVPNKSYLVEDDDDPTGPEDNDSVYGTRRRDTSTTNKSFGSNERDQRMIVEYKSQVSDLQGRIETLESRVQDKEAEVERLENGRRHHESAGNEWSQLRTDLENKLSDALSLNNNLQSEIEKAKSYHLDKEHSLRSQIDQMTKQESGENEWRSRYEELQQYHHELQRNLQEQQQITNEVKQEASSFLEEMKVISERSTKNYEHEEKLEQQVHRLEEEGKEWKSRYARVKTQLRTMRTNSMGLALQQPDARQYTKGGAFTHEDGLVKDIHVTKFQIAIDEVLRIARIEEPPAILDHMKMVIAAIRLICQDVSDDAPSDTDPLSSPKTKLRTKVSATANNFITASKNFAQANGLSPVSLLDAAASHLASAVIDLVKTVKIHASSAEELEADDGGINSDDQTQRRISPDYFTLSTTTHSSTTESLHSSPAPRGSSIPPMHTTSHLSASDSKPRVSRRSVSANAVPTSKALDHVRLPSYSGRGGGGGRNSEFDDLKMFLDDQTDTLLTTIQSLVSSVRLPSSDNPAGINRLVGKIVGVISDVVRRAQESVDRALPSSFSASDDEATMMGRESGESAFAKEVERVLESLVGCKSALLQMQQRGREVMGEREWRAWLNGLPPLAFEVAREVKGLGGLVERVGRGEGGGF